MPDGQKDCKDGKNDVSVTVKNAGTDNVGPFSVRLSVELDRKDVKEPSVSGLAAGQAQEVRFEDVRLTKGSHALMALADSSKSIAESNEDNDELSVTARCGD